METIRQLRKLPLIERRSCVPQSNENQRNVIFNVNLEIIIRITNYNRSEYIIRRTVYAYLHVFTLYDMRVV